MLETTQTDAVWLIISNIMMMMYLLQQYRIHMDIGNSKNYLGIQTLCPLQCAAA